MKYYIIAGEASGDLHGANLMKALSALDGNASYRCWGGDLMQQAGGVLVRHYRNLAFMGFLEVLMNLRTILRNLSECKEDIITHAPDVLILIDYPGFNMRIAKWAHKRQLKVVYYISPQIWAWKQSRVHALKRDVNRMICILPFEKDFYAGFNIEVDYVGHPLIDAIQNRPAFNRDERLRAMDLDPEKKVMAILPGSRKQEIRSMLPTMIKAAQKFVEYQIAIAVAPSQSPELYHDLVSLEHVSLLEGKTYQLLEIADMALVTSGTATLEAALFKVPQVVCYRGNWLSYWIARRLVKVKYISLVNLIVDREVVRELIQSDMRVSVLEREIKRLGKDRQKLLNAYEEVIEMLGGGGASARAASIIAKELT